MTESIDKQLNIFHYSSNDEKYNRTNRHEIMSRRSISNAHARVIARGQYEPEFYEAIDIEVPIVQIVHASANALQLRIPTQEYAHLSIAKVSMFTNQDDTTDFLIEFKPKVTNYPPNPIR